MEHLTKQDAQWLITEYDRIRQFGRVNAWIDHHVKAMSIIKNQKVNRPSCNCEFATYAQIANNMYEQHLTQIQQVANQNDVTGQGEVRTVSSVKRGRPKRSKKNIKN
jgi:hypothetical protein